MFWSIVLFPPKGERNSPTDYITGLNDKEQGQIFRYLNTLRNRDFSGWRELRWWKIIRGDIFQIRVGSYRILHGIDDSTIVVVNVFRKKTNKTPEKEILIAETNLRNYREQKRKG